MIIFPKADNRFRLEIAFSFHSFLCEFGLQFCGTYRVVNVDPVVALRVPKLSIDEQLSGRGRSVELVDGGRSQARGSEFAEFGDHFERSKSWFASSAKADDF